jgi:broad specificity phosphatase PhoE
MNRKLILIRHATTVAPEHTLVGKNDVELSKRGIEEARKLKQTVVVESANVKFYSSSLKRAIETAKILFSDARLSPIKCERDERINEIDFGDWTGLAMNKITTSFPDAIEEWTRRPMQFRFPGGESVNEFIARINDFLDSEILNKPEISVLVCHGGVIRFIICRMLNIDPSHHLAFSIRRPSLNVIDHDGKTGVLAGLNLTELKI